jgi:transcriptional regulator with XRE-family HTH domain
VDFGLAVRQARKARGWTQEKLGTRAGLSRQAVIRLERNRGRIATLLAAESSLGINYSGAPVSNDWGERVRAIRHSSSLSISGAAKKASIAENTLVLIERGGGSVESLARLISALAPDMRLSRTKRSKSRLVNINVGERRLRLEASETYRTPRYSFTPLLDYRPEWFVGIGCDPSAGDGRMLEEIVARGNLGPHWANDIRSEERALMRAHLPASTMITTSDYLAVSSPPFGDFMLTNPPFSLAMDFVQKARTHVRGPICILQSVAWQGTLKRSHQLRGAGLAYVLNLSRRPKWEVDVGKAHSNIWDFAWFVFLPNHEGLPQMDWLVEQRP